MKRLLILCIILLVVSLSGTLLTSCQTTTPTPAQKPAPVPTPTPSPLPSPTPTPAPTPKSVPEKTVEPAYTPTPPIQFPQQTNELDLVEDILKVEYVADGYTVESVLPSAFGLPGQLALLPNGDVVINDFSYKRLQILSNGKLSMLVGQDEVKTKAVAGMPDGRVCYINLDKHLILIDPTTRSKETLGAVPREESVQALAVDNSGNVYAVTKNNTLFYFTKDGERSVITTDLPFEQGVLPTISDMAVSQDGTIYIAGFNYFVSVSPDGGVTTITDDLQYEPTWCEVAPDGAVYIKDIFTGIRRIDPITGVLLPIKINTNAGVSDLLALSDNEFLFFAWGTDAIYKYNLTTGETVPIIVNTVNHQAFAAGSGEDVYLASRSLGSVLSSNIIRIRADGTKQSLTESTFDDIQAADVDKEGRLNIYADKRFYRFESDGTVNIFTPKFSVGQNVFGPTNFAVGPDGLYYCITRAQDTIKLWCVDETGEVTFLPISFNRASFGDPYSLGDARIDVGNDGRLALIVTALGSKGQGPFYQHVYQANADGTNLKEVAHFDSRRTGGMVDITVDDDNNIFVYVCQEETTGSGEVIYRISNNNEISTFMEIGPGRDPKSIDVDSNGNVWICTTVGIFKIAPD